METNGSNSTTVQTARLLFQPHFLVRHGNVQTLLALVKSRQFLPACVAEQPLLLDAGIDHTGADPERAVRLLAYYTPHCTDGPRRGLVMVLHGWEGSSHSHYNLLISSALLEAGYDVVRLNLRDHGPTHHLNRGLFYSTLIEEVLAATEKIAQLAADVPFFMVGASLGGNFVLRLANRWNVQDYPNLRHAIAVNPALNPSRACRLMDQQPLYRNYFRKRWLTSLQRKEELFPDRYDFAGLAQLPTVYAMTERLVQTASSFENAESYFASYAVMGNALQELKVPTTIITAEDDPIIPVQDFRELAPHPLLDVQIHPSGGHVGFAELFPFRHVLPGMVVEVVSG
jgi:uncharacterized protein